MVCDLKICKHETDPYYDIILDDHKMAHVKDLKLEMHSEEIPSACITVGCYPDIKTVCDAEIDFVPQNISDAIKLLKAGLNNRTPLYNYITSIIESELYNNSALLLVPANNIARNIIARFCRGDYEDRYETDEQSVGHRF